MVLLFVMRPVVMEIFDLKVGGICKKSHESQIFWALSLWKCKNFVHNQNSKISKNRSNSIRFGRWENNRYISLILCHSWLIFVEKKKKTPIKVILSCIFGKSQLYSALCAYDICYSEDLGKFEMSKKWFASFSNTRRS